MREKRTQEFKVYITPTTERRIKAQIAGTTIGLSGFMNQAAEELLDQLGVEDPDPQPIVERKASGRK